MITYELTKRLPILSNQLTLQFDRAVEAFEIYNNLAYATDDSYIYPIHSGEYLVWLVPTEDGTKKILTKFLDEYLEMTIEIPRGVENRIQWKTIDGSPIKRKQYSGATELPINFSQVVEAKEVVDWLKIAGRDAEINEDETLFVWKDPRGKASEITAEYADELDGLVAIIPDDSVVTTVQWTAQEPIPIEQMYHQVLHAPFFPKTSWRAVVNEYGVTIESAMTGILESIGKIEPKIAEYDKVIPNHEVRISNLELTAGTGDTYNQVVNRISNLEEDSASLRKQVNDLTGDVNILQGGVDNISDLIGDLHNLTTPHKDTLVNAINDAAKTGASSGGGSVKLDPTLIADSLNGVENKGLTEIIGLEELTVPANISADKAPLVGYKTKDQTIKSALNEIGEANLTAEHVADVYIGHELASNMLIVDSELSKTSTHPVQNKAITKFLLGLGINPDGTVGNIDDVRVNGTSVVNNKVANIDLSTKADKANTYTKTEVDELLEDAGKITDVQLNGTSILTGTVANLTDVYTKDEIGDMPSLTTIIDKDGNTVPKDLVSSINAIYGLLSEIITRI